MSEDKQAYCRKGFTCAKFATSKCAFKDDGRIFLECDAFDSGKAQEDKVVEEIAKTLHSYYSDAYSWETLSHIDAKYWRLDAGILINRLQSLGVIFPKPDEKWVQLDPDQTAPYRPIKPDCKEGCQLQGRQERP